MAKFPREQSTLFLLQLPKESSKSAEGLVELMVIHSCISAELQKEHFITWCKTIHK